MAVKLLIAAEANSGKTTLTKDLKDALVVSHDGKKFPFPVPHITLGSFDTAEDMISTVNEKIGAYKEKFGEYPKTIVFDSVSKIFDTMLDSCNTRYTGFKIYSELNAQIGTFTRYIEDTLIASDMNVVLISHAIFDADTGKYNLIGKGELRLAA